MTALSLVIAVTQTQLFAVCPLPNVEDNTPSPPTLSIPSEEPVALNHSTPVVRFVPPRFPDSNQIVIFQAHHGFQLLLLISHAACIGGEALQLGFLAHYLSKKPSIKPPKEV